MKKLLFTLLFLLFAGTANSQWVSNYGGDPNRDINIINAKGNAVAADNTGCVYVTGHTAETTGNDIVVIKYLSNGTVAWAEGYNGTANLDDEGTGICVDIYGNIYVVGSAQNTNRGYDVTLLKYNSAGVLQWARSYYSSALLREDRGWGIAVDAPGNIYITGYTTNTDNQTDIFTSKYDASGNEIWTVLEDGLNNLNSRGVSIAVSISGNVCVAGFVTVSGTNTDLVTLKYNSAGIQQWMRTENGTGNEEDKAWGIAVDQTDNVYVTGYVTESSNNTDYYTVKYNSAGVLQWSRTYNGAGNSGDKAWGIVVDTDGSIYIAGQSNNATQNTNYVTIKYSGSGTETWVSTYNGTGNGEDVANAITLVGTSSVAVTGKSTGATQTFDYTTVRYNVNTGNQLQVNRYSFNSQTEDVAKDLIFASNKIVVTGYSELIMESSSNYSYITTMAIDGGSELITTNNTPQSYSLYQNYPNPFNPSTKIKFDIQKSGNVKLAVYDVMGKEVDVLVNQNLETGSYDISFSSKEMASGIYFYELSVNGYREIKKMTLIK